MTSATANAYRGSLPQLGGGLLWLYRLAWLALAVAALVTSALIAVQPTAGAPVIALRLAKSAVLIAVAAILIYRRQRDPVAALLALAFLSWTITSSFDFGTDSEVTQLLDRCRFVLFSLALLLFPDGTWQPRWIRVVGGATGAVFLVGIGGALHWLPERLFLPLAIACVVAGIASLLARFRTSTNFMLKQQLKWISLGLVVGVGLILCARAGSAIPTSRADFMPIVWEGMFQLGIITVALGFLVSLLRYRLFDAETVITRSAAYAALTIALVATFGGTEALFQNIGQNYLGMNIGSISGGMAAAVAAVLLSPLHDRITDWAEDRFQPDLAQLKRTLPDLIGQLATSASTRQLAKAILPPISGAVHASRSAFLLDGRIVAAQGVTLETARTWARESLASQNASDLAFPVRLPVDAGLSGAATAILLGPRPDGTLYGKEDLEAVRSVIPDLQRALVSVRHRETVDTAIRHRESQLRAELGRISARLAQLERA